MPKDRRIIPSHFTIFRSASEEVKKRQALSQRLGEDIAKPAKADQAAATSSHEQSSNSAAANAWTNEGGHVQAKSGYIVQTSPGNFKVVINHDDEDDTEQPCATVRKG